MSDPPELTEPVSYIVRVGMAFAHPAIISMFTKLQMPFSISTPTLFLAIKALSPKYVKQAKKITDQVCANRDAFVNTLGEERFRQLGVGSVVGGNQANFIVVPILSHGENEKRDGERAKAVVAKVSEMYGIGVRYIGSAVHCEGCIRVTIGTAKEQKMLVKALQEVLAVV
ncbi:hypothetical protein ASPWEDRAFT_172130 [Aspergillus wentii DTO 134E9]|uniref:histidinol-phosphate transaminase n=1 Tax=Aspergillus wentii DTO 134E9 TaxID=1073089 RepID=A0A1L9RK49_ASPWE|nr:uncharacterized protein ASPWEDRAFT_172130 [Aspergillus wentii DTO 134E9]KAI9923483.1 histidinol-phosphate transaminase [Aspergillus wentii]OJJ35316.1 hypothetical protein ASPWEDRAFT_172130 [Aspergillus wentii DTO 134E9]